MKKIFILAVLTFTLVKFSYADDQSQQAVDIDQVKQDKIVQVPQDNGGFTSVEIKEINGVFIGPLGDRYYTFPTMHDLQLNYGNIPNEQLQASLQDTALKSQLLMRQMGRHAAEEQEKVDQANKLLADRIAQSNQQVQAQQQTEQETSQNQAKANSTGGGGMGALFFPIVLLGILIYLGINKYNNLVQARESVRNALNQINVLLKRRHDLIPNLMEATKGYMGFEKDTLEKVTKARQTAVNASNVQDKSRAENILTTSLRGFYAVAENYPNLKADQSVLQLQSQLTDTENKISVARQDYNNKVQTLNVIVQSFPDSIVAAIGHFEKEPFFKGEKAEEEAQVPQVKL
jgi:LemA protein